MRSAFLLVPVALLLEACLARTAVDVVTAPVRAVSQTADWATTSQAEADRNRGREIRRREEHLGRLERDYEKLARRCEDGSADACRDALAVRREIDLVLPTVPVEPERS